MATHPPPAPSTASGSSSRHRRRAHRRSTSPPPWPRGRRALVVGSAGHRAGCGGPPSSRSRRRPVADALGSRARPPVTVGGPRAAGPADREPGAARRRGGRRGRLAGPDRAGRCGQGARRGGGRRVAAKAAAEARRGGGRGSRRGPPAEAATRRPRPPPRLHGGHAVARSPTVPAPRGRGPGRGRTRSSRTCPARPHHHRRHPGQRCRPGWPPVRPGPGLHGRVRRRPR